MKRLKSLILLFFIAVSIPLAFVIWQTYSGLEQEERSQLRFFSEALFDEMEKELADLVQQEENRAVDDYGHILASTGKKDKASQQMSVLAEVPYQKYILGYLQNNPDGSFQTPLVADMGNIPEDRLELIAQLGEANRVFNSKKFIISQPAPETAPITIVAEKEEKKKDSFSERYLSRPQEAPTKTYLGKKPQRIEQITAEQAYNIASEDESLRQYGQEPKKQQAPAASVTGQSLMGSVANKNRTQFEADAADSAWTEQEALLSEQSAEADNQEQFQVEMAPFQSVSINDDQVYIFRRIAINNQIFRQGFVLLVEPLLHHLIASHYQDQPLAGFTALQMQRRDLGNQPNIVRAGVTISNSDFTAERIFPAPFDFLGVTLRANNIPSSPARGSLNVALIVLAVFMLLGLLTIYQSARTIVAMSERRSQFVSSVTHELKTPLTNIRMYIEMLEQGIAATPEREQEYLGILGSESARLSGLINNVLELAKLEKKQRRFHLQEGQLDDVLNEVGNIMAEKLKQEDFILVIKANEVPKFPYDRDVLIQILMNLIENSVKFGKRSATREITITANSQDDNIRIALSDTGPGIPAHALKKVFDDFYRVDNDLTRTTGGTGIGLALVKKFVTAMGGSVYATNNPGPGCTITILLPLALSVQKTTGPN